ncbi:MAG: Lrp/AsnC ligand binding domain-containing protein [Candidatus Bathyarchaeota archaeon]|nr:Lrp/AsnC ligand binding domain-containing protein [Candidatus Bathyarchaeota archaeon]
MPSAFVLINVETGTDETVFQALTQMTNITEAHLIYGVNDVIVKIEADSMLELKNAVMRIRRLDHVSSTTTIVVMPEASYVTS